MRRVPGRFRGTIIVFSTQARIAIVLLLGGAGLGACGGRHAPPPAPGDSSGIPPDLRGRTVMVLPVQMAAGLQGDPDAELAFALRGRAPRMHWVLPERIEAAVQRSPGLGARARGLPVGVFLQAEVERVGDPLYGQLRRLAAVVDAEVALLPVRVAPGPVDGAGHATVQVFAALVAVRSGRVLWFGVVEGTPGPPGGGGPLASAMERLARTLLWYKTR